MNNQFPPLPVRIFIGLLILSTIGYYAFRALAPETTSQLKAYRPARRDYVERHDARSSTANGCKIGLRADRFKGKLRFDCDRVSGLWQQRIVTAIELGNSRQEA